MHNAEVLFYGRRWEHFIHVFSVGNPLIFAADFMVKILEQKYEYWWEGGGPQVHILASILNL